MIKMYAALMVIAALVVVLGGAAELRLSKYSPLYRQSEFTPIFYKLTDPAIKEISPRSTYKMRKHLRSVWEYMVHTCDLSTPLRRYHFLAQIANETIGFSKFVEKDGKKYEGLFVVGVKKGKLTYGRTKWYKVLGNTKPGDGHKYRGRGWMQLTGKYNYGKYSKKLGIDLVSNPDMAANPKIAADIACSYWKSNSSVQDANYFADRNDIERVTRYVNGGTNHIEDRKVYLDRVQSSIEPEDAKYRSWSQTMRRNVWATVGVDIWPH